MAAYALNLTGFFYCQVHPTSRGREMLNWSYFMNSGGDDSSLRKKDSDDLKIEVCNSVDDLRGNHLLKPSFQKGVLRTNCIDCLDQTNVAQYAFGLVALGHQLHALGLTDISNIDLDSPLADDLMRIYETMGDTLALQYGGSAAHNMIFSQRRGQWKAATQSQELLRMLQRYYSNAYMDAEKQDAINVFLGHFQPHHGKPELWELDSDQHHNVGSRGSNFSEENMRSSFKRSLSDGNIICESNSPIENANLDKNENYNLPDKMQGGNKGLSESTPQILTCESYASYSRYAPAMSGKQLFSDMHPEQCFKSDNMGLSEHRDSFNCSNFLEADWHSSSGNSCEEEMYERLTLVSSPITGLSSDSVLNGLKVDTSTSESGFSMQVSAIYIDNRVLEQWNQHILSYYIECMLYNLLCMDEED